MKDERSYFSLVSGQYVLQGMHALLVRTEYEISIRKVPYVIQAVGYIIKTHSTQHVYTLPAVLPYQPQRGLLCCEIAYQHRLFPTEKDR